MGRQPDYQSMQNPVRALKYCRLRNSTAHRLSNKVVQHGGNMVTPISWKNEIIIPLPKKADSTEHNTWRGYRYCRCRRQSKFPLDLLNRLKCAVNPLLRQQQAGCRLGRLWMDQIFSPKQVLEQELIRIWDTRTWRDVSSYMITYLPLNNDASVEIFLK